METRVFSLSSPDATAQLAAAIGALVHKGDTLLLDGPVGAGKSHFARALIQSLQDNPEDVPSPTFTLVQMYDTVAGTIWHCDLYRLTDTQELLEIGLTEAFETSITLVEWPDRLGELCPPDALKLTFSPVETDLDARDVHMDVPLAWASRMRDVAA